MLRKLVLIASVLTLAVLSGSQSGGAGLVVKRHSSGITLLDGTLDPGRPPSRSEVGEVYQSAVDLARLYPDDLSWPWIDQGERVVVTTTNARGVALSDQIRARAASKSPAARFQLGPWPTTCERWTA
jgi:hypothetical protein